MRLSLFLQVQAQEEVIEAMSKELNQVKEGKALLEQEFQQYRKHSQVKAVKPLPSYAGPMQYLSIISRLAYAWACSQALAKGEG